MDKEKTIFKAVSVYVPQHLYKIIREAWLNEQLTGKVTSMSEFMIDLAIAGLEALRTQQRNE